MTFSARRLLAIAALLSLPVTAAPQPSDRMRLGPAHRAPLPASIDVVSVAPAADRIWFLGFDRSSDPFTPVVYSWSREGVTRVAIPSDATTSPQRLLAIAADRNGDAVLLDSGKVSAIRGTSLSPLAASSERIEKIAGGDGFWLLTAEAEIVHLAGIEGRAQEVGRLEGVVTAWSAGVNGELWYGTADGAVFSVRRGEAPKRLQLDTSAAVSAIHADASDQVWVGFADGRLARLVAGATDWYTPAGLPARFLSTDSWGNLLLAYGQPDSEDAWLLSQPRALRSEGETAFRKITFAGAQGAIRSLAVDAMGGTWITAGRAGAFRLQGTGELNWAMGDAQVTMVNSTAPNVRSAATVPDRNASQPLTNFNAIPGARLTNLNTTRGLVNDFVSCAVSDGSSMWFTTGYANLTADNESATGAGVSRWDHRGFTNYTAQLPSPTVQACAFDPATGSVWFGTTSGVARFLNGTFTPFLAGTSVQDIAVAGSDVWVATVANGVYRLSASTGATVSNFSISNLKTTSVVIDNTSTVWVGTQGGLYRFTGSGFTAEGVAQMGAFYVQDLEVDNSNNLWVSIWNASVYRRTPAGSYQQMLFGPVYTGNLRRVYGIRRDTAGNLWFGHGNFGGLGTPNAGVSFLPVSQVNAGSPSFQSYSTANGLPFNAVITIGREADGVWLGAPGGGVWRVGGPASPTGWPQSLSASPHYSSPLLADLDHDRDLEVVVGDQSGKVTAFRPDGTTLWTYDAHNAFAPGKAGDAAIQSSPSAGDVDGDGEIEVVVGVGGLGSTGGGVLILSRTGQLERVINTFDITGPAVTSDGLIEGVFATPVLANVDADPELEIVFGALDNMLYAVNGDGRPIYQRDDDGDGRYDEDFLGDTTPYTPFVSSDDCPGICGVNDDGDGQTDEGISSDDDEDGLVDEDYWEWPYNARDTSLASAVVPDLNRDGQRELIFAHDYSGGANQEFNRGGVLRVFNTLGKNVFGFPRGNLEQVIWSSPIAIDLDNDGNYEIAHGSGIETGTLGTSTAEQLVGRLVYAWRSNGQPFRSCGAGEPTGCFARTEGRSFASFAAGDLDNDGNPELVIATLAMRNRNNQLIDANGNVTTDAAAVGQQLYAFKQDGSLMPGFPVRPNPAFPSIDLVSSPVLADIDNDGFLNILIGVRQGLMVFDRFGRVVPGMGVYENLQEDTLNANVSTTPAVADINLDGSTDIVWSAPTGNGSTGIVRVVSVDTMNAGTYQRSWPQWRRSMNRNAIFGPLVSVTQGWENGGTLLVRAQALGGRTALASVVANLSAVGGGVATVMGGAANSFFETTVNVAALAPGRYHVPVTATDGAGQTDTQTLVFVKRGGTKQLAVSTGTLAFGSVVQGETGTQQLGIVNIGNQAVTVTGLSTNSAEFSVASPGAPQTIQAGQSLLVNIRFRPGAAAGARSATLTIASDDAVAPSRAVTLTGSTTSGAGGCNVTLVKKTVSQTGTGAVPFEGEKGVIGLTTNPAGCAWTSSSDVPWLQIYPLAGNGSIDMSYTVFPNLTLRPRSAKVRVNGTVLTITQNQAGNNENERFIAALYFASFGRYPSAADIQFHVGTLGADRAAKAADFFTSGEFNLLGRFISGVYLGLLGRLPEYGGWQFQRNAVASAGAGAQQALARNFLQSQEFLLNHPSLTNEQFVRFLYQSILGRQPSQAEVNFQLSTMGTGDINARAQKATEFLNVPEYTTRTGPDLLATLIYFVFLQRGPTVEEFNAMRARIPRGATRDQLIPIIREILESAEYRGILI